MNSNGGGEKKKKHYLTPYLYYYIFSSLLVTIVYSDKGRGGNGFKMFKLGDTIVDMSVAILGGRCYCNGGCCCVLLRGRGR